MLPGSKGPTLTVKRTRTTNTQTPPDGCNSPSKTHRLRLISARSSPSVIADPTPPRQMAKTVRRQDRKRRVTQKPKRHLTKQALTQRHVPQWRNRSCRTQHAQRLRPNPSSSRLPAQRHSPPRNVLRTRQKAQLSGVHQAWQAVSQNSDHRWHLSKHRSSRHKRHNQHSQLFLRTSHPTRRRQIEERHGRHFCSLALMESERTQLHPRNQPARPLTRLPRHQLLVAHRLLQPLDRQSGHQVQGLS